MGDDEYSVLDLFCGAGGMSRGFERAGYDVVAGVDYDKHSVETYRKNFNHRAIREDLSLVGPKKFSKKYDVPPEEVDVIVGGPPCQGFSTANQHKDDDDERNNLVFRFHEYVNYYKPATFLMENVVGIKSMSGGKLINELRRSFSKSGYDVEYTTLDSVNYGVPQTRRRVFFQGKLNDDKEVVWPDKTHSNEDELKDVVSIADAICWIREKDYQTSQPSEPLQLRGERKCRRCHEPAYTVRANVPSAIIPSDEPVGNVNSITDVESERLSVRDLLKIQSFDSEYILTPETVGEKRRLVGNAVPPLVAEKIANAI